MKRPWMWPAIGFAGGILALEISGLPAGGLGLGLVVLYLVGRWRDWPELFVLAGWGFAGGLAWWIERTPLSPDDLRLAAEDEPQWVEVLGRVAETPVLRLSEYRGQPRPSTAVAVEIHAWETPAQSWGVVRGEVMTRTQGEAPAEIFPGQSVRIRGVLRRPPPSVAPGLFDYREHLRHRGISHLLEAESFADWSIATNAPVAAPWSAAFLPWARRALSHGLPDDESTRLLWAMTLGWRTALTESTSRPFVEAGTLHVFAISGLHIALLAGAGVALLRFVRVSRAGCGVVVLPLIWLYVAATGWQPSAVRSVVMMTVVVGGWALRRPGDVLNSLSLAALILLIASPGQIFQAGFQLSFAAVAGLALWAPEWGAACQRRLSPPRDPFLPESLQPVWRARIESGVRQFSQSLAVSAAALAATLPLTLHLFNLVSPISLVANLVVVPLSGLALAANLGALATFGWFPELAGLFNAGAWLWMGVMTGLSRWLAGWPGAVWAVRAPSWGWWLIYYSLVLVPSMAWFRSKGVRRVWGAGVLGAILTAVGVGLGSRSTVEMALLPGGIVVVDGPGRSQDWVMNAGGEREASRILIPWLRSRGWNRLPRFLVSQADVAHLGGGTNLLAWKIPGEVIIGSRHQRSPVFRQFLKVATEHQIPLKEVAGGSRRGEWSVLSPPRDAPYRTAADNALVLAGRLAGLTVVVVGEAGPEALDGLMQEGSSNGGEFPHPGRVDLLVGGVTPKNAAALRRWISQRSPRCSILTRIQRPTDREDASVSPRQWGGPIGDTVWMEAEEAVILRFRRGTAELERAGVRRRIPGEGDATSL